MAEPQFAARPDLHGAAEAPAHARITSWLEKLIVSAVLAPGDRLPSEVEFAEALGVSRMTLRQALAAIEAKGLIDRRRGRFGGNFVCAPRFEFDHANLPGFTEQMRRIDVEAGARVLRARTVRPAADVRRHLELSAGARVHEVLRARTAHGEPILLEQAHLPAAVFPGLLSSDLTGSLYSIMRGYGAAPASADEQIEATRADAATADVLGVAPGDPVLLITRTARTEGGVAVEFSRDYHRSDRTRLCIRARVGG